MVSQSLKRPVKSDLDVIRESFLCQGGDLPAYYAEAACDVAEADD